MSNIEQVAERLPQSIDVVAIAAQIGRLDFISAMLATLTVILALISIPYAIYLRSKAANEARIATKEYLDGVSARIEQEAVSKIEALLPTLVEEYLDLARRSIEAEKANEIAASLDSEGDDVDDNQRDQAGAGKKPG